MSKVIVICGVAGSGKTTVGEMLSSLTGGEFHDADDFHPMANVEKMSRGIPLNDDDRVGWLDRLCELIAGLTKHERPSFLACSALKNAYRDKLRGAAPGEVEFVFLHGSREVILQRMRERKDHYMPPSLLDSQFDTLEPPDDALAVDISQSVEDIVSDVMRHYPELQAARS